jgi:hypothetical protein
MLLEIMMFVFSEYYGKRKKEENKRRIFKSNLGKKIQAKNKTFSNRPL